MVKMTKKECASKLDEALKVRMELVEKGLIEDVNEEIKQLAVSGSKEYGKVKADDILEVAIRIEAENAEVSAPEEIVEADAVVEENKATKEYYEAKAKECLVHSKNNKLSMKERQEHYKKAMEYFNKAKA